MIPRGALAAAAVAALAPAASVAAAPATGWVPCRARAARPPAAAPAPARAPSPDVAAELAAFDETVRRLEEEARAYRGEVQEVVRRAHGERRRFLSDHYEQAIRDLEVRERNERDEAIARVEEFLARYPDDPRHTPDAMFRLAELHYEKANDDFALALEAHRDAARRALGEGRDPPPEPAKSYAPSIALYQRLVTRFPHYPLAGAVQYLLAYCLGEMGQGPEALAAYRTLIERHPRSAYVPEAWLRLGDWWFDAPEAGALARAADAFARVAAMPEHPLRARALYKLGWTAYRMDDFPRAVDAFTRLLDHYVATAAGDAGAGAAAGEVWPEAVRYTAISFADERGGGVDGAVAWFASIGGRPYEAEVYARLGDAYLEETRYPQAVAAWKRALARAPLSPDAPRLQGKIVQAWARDRRFDEEAREREALVAAYGEGGAWWSANQGDPDLLAAVRDLSEASLLRAASFHHAQAQAYKASGNLEGAVAEYRVAARVYGDHLARFPHARRAPEIAYNHADCLYNGLDFEAAAREYARVRDDPAGAPFAADAALSAVISWEGEVARQQRAGRLTARPVRLSTQRKDEPRAAPVPDPLQGLVRDSDAFVQRFPDHPKAAAIAYKAGEVFYVHDELDEARCRLEEVAARWPASEVAGFAANLVIESHLAEKDWEAVEAASARLQASEVARDPALRASLQKFKLGGRFNRARQLMEARRWDEAAALFLALVREEPAHEFADEALYNAASCHEGARRFESALRLYERLPAEYPTSDLADQALFRVGVNAENTYDFEKAVDRYLALVQRYPRSRHRKDAMFDAARSLEALERHSEAAAAFARYAQAYPDAGDAARTLFHAALVWKKARAWSEELATLRLFQRRFGKGEPDLAVQAELETALAWRALGKGKEARVALAAAVRAFAGRKLDPDAHPRAAAAAAEARFRLAEIELERYDRGGLPATSDERKLRRALEAKFADARKVAAGYDEVMRYRRPDWILAAFYRKAYVLDRLAQTLYDAPAPPEFRRKGAEEYLAAYQDALAQKAQPYEEQAVAVYVQAIEAARKLHVRNEWTKRIGESLARHRPREYPVLEVAKARMVEADVSPAPLADTTEGPSRRAATATAAPEPAGGPRSDDPTTR